ncbi:hypothetical protein NL108_008198 [Boleophthalmus pectinirostris]|nr:hypothetical protein NL108_008198 [Boleophthalmus pectinirostris]
MDREVREEGAAHSGSQTRLFSVSQRPGESREGIGRLKRLLRGCRISSFCTRERKLRVLIFCVTGLVLAAIVALNIYLCYYYTPAGNRSENSTEELQKKFSTYCRRRTRSWKWSH